MLESNLWNALHCRIAGEASKRARFAQRRRSMSESSARPIRGGPLEDIDDWESAHQTGEGDRSGFRDYRENVRAGVREFYQLNHRHQTLNFVLEKKRMYLAKERRAM